MKTNERLTLEPASKEDFLEVYEDMKQHFNKDELKTYEQFISRMGDSEYVFLHIKHGGAKVGYMFLFLDQENKFIWLEYFVIKNEFQSRGYGSEGLEALKSFFPDMKGMFMEIEPADENAPNTIKRIRFYERHGAKKLDLDYIYPNKSGGRTMHLFFFPIQKGYTPSKEETFKVIKKAFGYFHKDIPDINQIYARILSSAS